MNGMKNKKGIAPAPTNRDWTRELAMCISGVNGIPAERRSEAS